MGMDVPMSNMLPGMFKEVWTISRNEHTEHEEPGKVPGSPLFTGSTGR